VSDFYEPGQTYKDDEYGWKFRCDTVTTHPDDGQRTALGWRYFRGDWEPYAYGEDDWEIHTFVDDLAASTAQMRQQEDPHTSPLHHDYLTPHDLPPCPHQQDRRWL